MMYVRSSLEYYDTLAHLVEILNLKLWELYAFSYEYYTTKSRNSQPLKKFCRPCTWQRPRSMLRSLSPQVSERFI